MKKISVSLIFIFVLFFLPFTIWAQDNNKNVILTKNEIINKDYFAAGNSVSLEGTVNGDAYLAGGNIVVDGTINGDLIAAGGNMDIRGTVTGNIRAAGGNINLNRTVGRNVSLAGGSLSLASNANITGSLAAAGGNLAVFSPVGKEANLAGGQITLGSRIGADTNAVVDQLSLAPQATISGNLTYWSRNKASISESATVSGRIIQNIPKGEQPQETEKKGVSSVISFFRIVNFIGAAIIGILLLIFMPIYFDRTTEYIMKRPWASLGIGFLTAIVFPFAANYPNWYPNRLCLSLYFGTYLISFYNICFICHRAVNFATV
ncbi:MAG: FapA family protein [Patescibacteria group bacterium]|nr:FapA family protein [Patescibacteria group bacterium]